MLRKRGTDKPVDLASWLVVKLILILIFRKAGPSVPVKLALPTSVLSSLVIFSGCEYASE